MTKFTVTDQQHVLIDRRIWDLKRRLYTKKGSPLDPELVAEGLLEIIEGRFPKSIQKISDIILSPILAEETLVLEAMKGCQNTIARAKDIFQGYLDSDFKKWGLDNNQLATEEIAINIYELAKNVNYSQMFNSLNSDLDKLCLTQSQIILFCEKYPTHLRQDGYATFFLFKENREYFVANVDVDSGGLDVDVSRFEDDDVWYADHRHRVVVPATV